MIVINYNYLLYSNIHIHVALLLFVIKTSNVSSINPPAKEKSLVYFGLEKVSRTNIVDVIINNLQLLSQACSLDQLIKINKAFASFQISFQTTQNFLFIVLVAFDKNSFG